MMSTSALSFVQRVDEYSRQLNDWSLSIDALKGNQGFVTYERVISNSAATYKIADIVAFSYPKTEKLDADAILKTLKKISKLNGLSKMTIQGAIRIEGFDPQINRQVVYFVSNDKKNNRMLVSYATYRDSYGSMIGLETELISRLVHNLTGKKDKKYSFVNLFISNAYAEDPCAHCNGNPICLMSCNSQGSSSSAGTSSAGFGGLDLSSLTQSLDQTNAQLEVLNKNVAVANINWATSNNKWQQTNQNWMDTNDIIDQRSQEAIELAGSESQAWRKMTKKESEAWREMTDEALDRALTLGENLTDPTHLFKMAAASAAGAVVGATAASMAINGAKAIVGFIAKWARGDFKKMKEDQILKEFNDAKKAWYEGSKKLKGLEQTIDQTLRAIELSKKFDLSNPLLIRKLDIKILDYEDRLKAQRQLASSYEQGSCDREKAYAKVLDFKNEITELKTIVQIMNQADPLIKACKTLKDALRELVEAEGILQRARPNILKAEKLVNKKLFQSQKDAAETMVDLQRKTHAQSVNRGQKHHLNYLAANADFDINVLASNASRDCRKAFRKTGLKKQLSHQDIKKYCATIIGVGDGSLSEIQQNLAGYFGDSLTKAQRGLLVHQFNVYNLPQSVAKYGEYVSQKEKLFEEAHLDRKGHKSRIDNMNDLLTLDPEIAAEEIRGMNKFFENIMSEQSLLYTKDLRDKRYEIEEKCAGVDPYHSDEMGEDDLRAKILEAQADIDKLNGKDMNGTIVHCAHDLEKIECANALKDYDEHLKTNPSDLQRIVIVPRSKMLTDSMVYAPKSGGYNFAQISVGVSAKKLDKKLKGLETRILK